MTLIQMGNCKDCKWWERFTTHDEIGHCGSLKVRRSILRPIQDCASTNDGSLYTGPEFGCVNFQQKTEDDK